MPNNKTIALIGLVVAIITMLATVLMVPEVRDFLGSTTSDNNTEPKTIDCGLTTELGPWSTPTDVTINPNGDGWVQADFWSPSGQLVSGYDEVSVIFEPAFERPLAM